MQIQVGACQFPSAFQLANFAADAVASEQGPVRVISVPAECLRVISNIQALFTQSVHWCTMLFLKVVLPLLSLFVGISSAQSAADTVEDKCTGAGRRLAAFKVCVRCAASRRSSDEVDRTKGVNARPGRSLRWMVAWPV